MQKITYDAKAYINENPSVPAANKVQAADLNEIKTVVNANADATHTWVELARKTGAASVTISPDYRDLLVLVKVGGNENVMIPIYMPNAFVQTLEGTFGFNGGYYRSASVNAFARISANPTTLSLAEAYLNGTDAKSYTDWVVYYR